ncbi:hypothetical protein NHX12_033412 [Muraenolepis orangiensis]|uniref:Immediate early response 5 n=1 Tax=Muraenolepis orangiensis TaxID=630683 RepID=A0A9Q0E1M5_9TELE|nr:hypothetical protein NHX12_033412 [Muraenolepis orangiensis]
MEQQVEAHRVMSLSLGKIYGARVQRGGVRLHRNLLVSLVLRSARHVYLSEHYGGDPGHRDQEDPDPEHGEDIRGDHRPPEPQHTGEEEEEEEALEATRTLMSLEARGGADPEEACGTGRKRRSADSDGPAKRTRLSALSDEEGGGHVTSLISIFGSGFSGLLSKDAAEVDDSGAVCREQMLPGMAPWTSAIEAF